jgi:hypothetical protein
MLASGGECSIAGDKETGALQTANCDQSAGFGSGCGVVDGTSVSYGTGFNANNGGVFATQWTSDFIRIWFFPSGRIPSDITDGAPDPSTWGLPVSNFEGSCEIDDHFKNHNIIFDTTFCGGWGAAVLVSISWKRTSFFAELDMLAPEVPCRCSGVTDHVPAPIAVSDLERATTDPYLLGSDPVCGSLAPTCTEYVAANPSVFSDM